MLIIYVLFNSLFLIDIFRYYSNLEMANAWNGLFCVRVQTPISANCRSILN